MIHFDRMRSRACPSGYQLDRLMAGELDADADELRRHMATCAPCTDRLEEMRRMRARFRAALPRMTRAGSGSGPRALLLAPRGWSAEEARGAVKEPPPALLIPRVPAAAVSPKRRPIRAAAGAALAAAAALFLVDPGRPRQPEPELSSPAGERRKGPAVRVHFYVEHDGELRAGGPREIVHPGDVLQFVYTAEEAAYLALISRDGAGVGSVYFDDRGRAALLEPGDGVSLPSSVRLDSVLGRETIYAVACDRAIETEPLRRAIAARAEVPPTPPGCRLDPIHIDKRAP